MAPEQERTSAVTSDMKRIFGDEAETPIQRQPPPARARPGTYTPPPPRKGSGGALAGRAVALAIGIVALVIGSVLITREVRSWFSPAPPTASEVASEVAAPKAVDRPPDASYVPPAPLPAETQAASVATEQAEPPSAASFDLGATPSPSAEVDETPRPRPISTARSLASASRSARAEPTPRPRATPRAREARSAAARAAPARTARCRPGSTSDDCIYADVLAAHRRLETAYDSARRAGLNYREIRNVRRDWDRARDISLDEPDETIRRYDSLAARLRRAMRDEEQAGGPDPDE